MANYFDRFTRHIYTLQPQEQEKNLNKTNLSTLIDQKEYTGISELAASAQALIDKSDIKNKRDPWYRFRTRELKKIAKAKEEEKQEPKPSLSPLVEEDLEDFPFMFPPTPFDTSSASVPTTPMNFNSIAASFASPSPFVENQRKKRKFEVDSSTMSSVSSLRETSVLASASKKDIEEVESEAQFLQRYVTNILNGFEERVHSFFNHIDPTYKVVLDDLEDCADFTKKLNNTTNFERRSLANKRYNKQY